MEQSLTEEISFLNEDIFRLSFDSEQEDTPIEPWYSLIRNLTCDQIQSLHTIFKEKILRGKFSKSTENIGLTKEEFVNAIDEICGIGKYSFQATLLFNIITKESEVEVKWPDFVNFVLKNLIPTTQSKLVLGKLEIFAIPHVKRETIIKIVSIEIDDRYFCYAVISKHGHVGVYDGNMDFLTSYYVVMTKEDILKDEKDRRRRNRWITDALFSKDVQCLFIANTTRSISIYDASGMKHNLLWIILSLPNVVLCLYYHINALKGESVLFMGDDQGRVISLKFFQTKTELLRKKYNDKASAFYWLELPEEKQYVSIKNYGKIHNDFIRQIEFIGVNGSIITCSRDRNVSLVNKHITNKRQTYTFRMNRGADCFILSNSKKHVITGSSDGIIRVWDIVSPSHPIMFLSDHRSGIVGFECFDAQDVLISCSRDANLKVWDIKDYKCVQNIKLKYPVFDVFGKNIEWGSSCMVLGPKRAAKTSETSVLLQKISNTRSHMLVTCCNYIARIKLSYPKDSDIEIDLEMPILPPPPLQNSVLIPKTWKIDDSNDINNVVNLTSTHDHNIEEHYKSLKFILDKDLMADFYNCTEDINYKIAVLEKKKIELKENVARGAPFLALNLSEIEEVVLSSDLPIPKKRSIQALVEKTQTMLSDAANRNNIFSDASSSRSKSSRSSIIEFE